MAKKVIKDNRGQWAHPGKITKIDSNKITMKGIPFPVIGVSNKGDKKLMLPNQDYEFIGDNVTEYPLMSDSGQLKKLDQLTNFTNMNKAKHGKKAQKGRIVDKMIPASDSVSNIRTYTRQQFLDAKDAYITGKKPVKPNPFYDNWDLESYAVSRFEKEPYESLTLGSTHSPDGNVWPDQLIKGIKSKASVGKNKSNLLNPVGETAVYDPYNQVPIKQKHGGKLKKAQYGQTEEMKKLGISVDETMGLTPIEPVTGMDKIGWLQGALGIGTDLVKGFQFLKEEKKQKNQAKQFLQLSELTQQAADAPIEKPKRKYVRPEDTPFEQNQLSPSYGTGTNFLAKNGGKAQFGAQAGQLGSMIGSFIGGGKGQQSGAGMIGGTIGSTVGKLIPIPGADAILGGVGGLIGGIIGGKKAKDTAEDQEAAQLNLMGAAAAQNIHNQYSKNMRTGGNLRRNQMAMGGDLKVYKGEAEHLSSNPYLPDGGQTVMFKGPSHEDGGMPVKFGKSNVEVEGGEPAVKLQDGGNTESLTIFGDMKIPSYGVSEINDPKAKGKKFKNYINDLSKIEDKQNKTIVKGGLLAGETEGNSLFDQLKLNSGKAMITGADMKLKDIAQKKQMASIVQNAILKTAEEHGLKSDELAKGHIKKAKNGDKIAQWGTNQLEPVATYNEPTPITQSAAQGPKKGLGDDWMTVVNAALPFIRPSNRLNLDPTQLSGEMYALSNNQLDAVQAQQYNPLLEQSVDVSLQDQLNANQADFNAIQRTTQNNPQAQAALAAQKYAANSSVLGQQFRMNQENKLGTYNRNRGVLNDATLKNLAILDQQYVRQSTAKSNTKAVAQAALSSIADKIAKNKLENRTLGVYENLYNYRFGPNGYAWNLNPLAQFNTQGTNLPVLDSNGKEITEESKQKYDRWGIKQGSEESTKVKTPANKNKNGGIVKAMKKM